MKTHLCVLPFAFCLALVPARAADQPPAPVDKPAIDVSADLPKKTDPLIDPLTGTPYIAVHNPDIVESVIFVIEFQRAHPTEHAVLLTGDIKKPFLATKLDPAVAFSWQGKVYLHSYAIGDVLIPGILPEQIDANKSKLHDAFLNLLRYYYQKSYEKLNIPYPLSRVQAYKMGIMDTAPHVLPNELPGDTLDIQAKRVEARLIKLGLTGTKAYFNLSGEDKYGNLITFDRVVFNYRDLAYAWSRYGNAYWGLASKTYLPSLIDSIVFSIDYQKANPSEKVFCFLHETSDKEPEAPSDIVATTIYTKNGQLWFHHLAPGDLPSALTLDDLKDSDKVIDADLATYYPALKKFDEQESRLRHQSPAFLGDYLKGYKAPDLSVTGVLAELQKRGVEAKITGDANHPELLFVWGKRPYTYQPGIGCSPAKSSPLTAAN
jgi:hypothetical protein